VEISVYKKGMNTDKYNSLKLSDDRTVLQCACYREHGSRSHNARRQTTTRQCWDMSVHS